MRAALVVIGLLALALIVYGVWPGPEPGGGGTLQVGELLGAADAAGFDRAEGARAFVFPADHGPHPGFRTEWWYFTGNLSTGAGRDFGYQLTFFRSALAPEVDGGTPRRSAWAARDVYLAHFALSDPGARRFIATERFSRAALGLAGAQAEPFRVWLEDWEARGGEGGFFPLALHARTEDASIALTLWTEKPVVLQGDGGLSAKGPEPGNASWYYSYTRMPTRGEVRVGGEVFEVEGASWMDREWSTSALGPGLVGWDWFALQLSNGYDLMLYQLRRRDGSKDPFSAATLVDPEGAVVHLDARAFQLLPLEQWTSPRGGTRYPIAWRALIPEAQVALTIEAAMPDQELDLSVRYWEGAVRVRGTFRGAEVQGRGYLELTGYARDGDGQRFVPYGPSPPP